VADVGYYHGHEVQTCPAAGITPYVPRPITSANEKLGLFSKEVMKRRKELVEHPFGTMKRGGISVTF